MKNTNKQNAIAVNHSLDSCFNRWTQLLQVKHNTEIAYKKWARKFVDFCVNRHFSIPSAVDAVDFFNALKSAPSQRRKGEHISPATVRLAITAVKQFVKFLRSEHLLADDITAWIKPPKVAEGHKKDDVSAADCKLVILSFDTDNIFGARNQAIVALMMLCGLRAIEVVRADCHDIVKRGNDTYLLVQGKGRDEKDACVKLPPQLIHIIEHYLDLRGDRQGALFKSRKSNGDCRLDPASVSRITKSAFRNVGIDSPRVTCHSCRHSAATNALRAGVSIEHVQMMLRHKNITTTFIYRHDLERQDNQAELAVADSILGGF